MNSSPPANADKPGPTTAPSDQTQFGDDHECSAHLRLRGVGLPLCQAIARSHKGLVTLEATRPTRFALILPIVQTPAPS
jgi:light-regulated signal transduction histidine kinase (bacteriophytochrome)